MLRDCRDIVGGGVLALSGIAFGLYGFRHYDLGSLSNMGPGLFPAALGVLLGVLGLAIAMLGFVQRSSFPEIRVRVPVFVLAGTAAFAVTLPAFGMVPAICAVTAISSFAETRIRPISIAALALSLCLMAWLIFGVGLRLPIAMLSWPF